MTTMTAEEARTSFSDVLKRAQYGKESTLVTVHSKKAAAVIPVEQYELLQAVLEKFEYLNDVEDARAALAEIEREGTVSWEDLKAELDL